MLAVAPASARSSQQHRARTAADCPDTTLSVPAGALSRIGDATLCLINVERMRRDLRPLSVDRRLARAARRHSQSMVAMRYFAHEGPDGAGVADRLRRTGYIPAARRWRVAENIAWIGGTHVTAQFAMQLWMNSAGHRANILDPRLREIGVGVANGSPSGSYGRALTFTTDFGYRR